MRITDRIGFVDHFSITSKLFRKHQIKSIVDFGAGTNPQEKLRERFGVSQLLIDLGYPDSQTEVIVRKRTNINDYTKILQDIRNLTFVDSNGKVEAAISLQNIEHLTREQGMSFLNNVEKFASKLIIVETPNGFVEQSGTAQNPFQEHLSGWSVKDFKSKGYKVLGTSGLKCLKQNRNKGAYKINIKGIKLLDVLISRLFFIHHFPRLSFNIYAYKIMSDTPQ